MEYGETKQGAFSGQPSAISDQLPIAVLAG
jgi:hypothetical protein